MSRGSSSLGGGGGFSGGFSGGHSGSSGIHHGHSSNGGLLTGLVIGSLLSRGGGSGSSGSSGNYERPDPTQGGKYKRVKNTTATYVTSLIFLAVTVVFVVLSFLFRFDAVYVKTKGVATDYSYNYPYYYTTYDFVVDGTTYSVESKAGWTKLEHMEGKAYTQENINTYYLNKEYEIYYKKTNVYEVYEVESKADMPSTNAIYIFFAVIFGIVTLIVFSCGIYKYELDPEYEVKQREAEKNKPVDGKRRCQYCNSLIDEKTEKCPNCGASQK